MNIKSIRKLSALIGASASHFTLYLSLFTLLSLLLPLTLSAAITENTGTNPTRFTNQQNQ